MLNKRLIVALLAVVVLFLGIFSFAQGGTDDDEKNENEKKQDNTPTGSEKDTTAPVITLTGDNEVTVQVNTNYVDAGATAKDDEDGDITNSIVVNTETITTNVLGTYTVTYNVSDKAGNKADEVTRTVRVVDTTRPVITMIGGNVTIPINGTYTDAGATAVDNYDGNITNKIVTTGTVNPNVIGTYMITYNVTDTNNNTAIPVVRRVFVVDKVNPLISLNGDSPLTVEMGVPYVDAGATAVDNYDGNITNKIITSGVVNVNALGTYYITYNVTDNEGNAAVPVTRTVIVDDTTPPTVLFETNGNNGVYALNASTKVTITDSGVGVDPASSFKYAWTTSTTAPLNIDFEGSNFNNGDVLSILNDVRVTDPNGIYYLWILAKDTKGNDGTTHSKAFYLDNEGPAVTFDPTTDTDEDHHKVITVTVTDFKTSVDGTSLKYRLSTSNVGTHTEAWFGQGRGSKRGTFTSGQQLTFNLQGDHNVYYLWIYSKDTLGNVTITKSGPIKNEVNTGPTISLNPNGNTTPAQTYSTTVTVTDPMGVDASSLKYRISTDLLNPNSLSEWWFNQGPANHRGTFTAGGTITTPSGVTGNYYLYIYAEDTLGTPSKFRSNVFTLDNNGPQVIFNPNTDIDEDNQKTIQVILIDNAGIDVNSLKYKLSTSNATTHSEEWFSQGSGGQWRGTFSNGQQLTFNLQGDHNVYYLWIYAKDALGNSVVTKSGPIKNETNTGPVISFGTNGNVNPAKTHSTTVTATDPMGVAAGSLKYRFSADLVNPNSLSESWFGQGPASYRGTFLNGGTVTTPTGLTGNYYLYIYAEDTLGTTSRARTNAFNLDNTIPVITRLGDATVTVDQGTPYVDAGATASDTTDGNITSSIVTVNPVNPNTVGSYTVTYNVTDTAGNAAVQVTRTVTVVSAIDSTGPTVVLGTNGHATATKSSSTTVTVEDPSGIDTTSFRYRFSTEDLDPTSQTDGWFTSGNSNFRGSYTNGGTVTTPSSQTGNYYLYIIAKDTVGNTTKIKSNIFKLDNTKPTIIRTGSASVTVTQGTSYTDAGATASDTTDGNITSSIVTVNPVNINIPGTYTVTYNVTDTAGNAADQVTRTVNVVAPITQFTFIFDNWNSSESGTKGNITVNLTEKHKHGGGPNPFHRDITITAINGKQIKSADYKAGQLGFTDFADYSHTQWYYSDDDQLNENTYGTWVTGYLVDNDNKEYLIRIKLKN